MSWDVWLFVAPDGIESVDEMTPDYEFPTIDPNQVLSEAASIFGYAIELREGWGNIDGPVMFAEVSLPRPDDEAAFRRGSVHLHVRGGGPSSRAIELILELADRLGCRAYDNQAGDWLTVDGGGASAEAFRQWRSKVVRPDAGS